MPGLRATGGVGVGVGGQDHTRARTMPRNSLRLITAIARRFPIVGGFKLRAACERARARARARHDDNLELSNETELG
jgi:hypothetical protein